MKISFSRNPFSIGWTGIPDCWPHVLEGVVKTNPTDIDIWDGYWIRTNDTNVEQLRDFEVNIIDKMSELQMQFKDSLTSCYGPKRKVCESWPHEWDF